MTKRTLRGAVVPQDARKPAEALRMPERQLQELVRRTALVLGWRFFHPWTSIKSAPGYPDCTLVRGERLIFAELKTERGKLTPAQVDWLAALGRVPGVEVYIFRPAQWYDGTIETILRGEG